MWDGDSEIFLKLYLLERVNLHTIERFDDVLALHLEITREEYMLALQWRRKIEAVLSRTLKFG
jgi:hypothetical protein